MRRFDGKIALVTGSTLGLGQAIAELASWYDQLAPAALLLVIWLLVIGISTLWLYALRAWWRQELTVRMWSQRLVWAGVPGLLLASLLVQLNDELYSLAAGLWRSGATLALCGVILLTLLRWSRRARVTFRR